MSTLINGGNYFHQRAFEAACNALDKGEAIRMYIDCIGHTRNNTEQEEYKNALIDKYGEKIIVTKENGGYSYSYSYQLKPN
ncbi:MAG: hypothetical protein IKT44_00360 [Clostridia bacterium]|nr:hypothetical protein [Clostridia bacterium]